MKILITGRHFDVSNELRQYAEKKFKKLDKYFDRLIDIQITMYMEKHNHVVEAVINADAARFHAVEKASDMYPSIDLLVKSLEKQAVKHKEKHKQHKAVSFGKMEAPVETTEGGLPLIFLNVSDKPKDEIEAFLEMKIDNRDFILFKKFNNKDNNLDFDKNNYAVIYRDGDLFKMAEILIDMDKDKKINIKGLSEFDVVIKNDSVTNPDIKFKKCSAKIKSMTIDNAVKEAMDCESSYLPFLNSETNYLNIINRTKENIEIITPQ